MRELSDKDYLLGLVGVESELELLIFVFLWVKFYIYVTPHHEMRHKSEIQKLRF